MKYTITLDFEGPETGVIPVNEGDPNEYDVIERKLRAVLYAEMQRLQDQFLRTQEPTFSSEKETAIGKQINQEFVAELIAKETP